MSNDNLPADQVSQSKPVRTMTAVLAAYTFIVGGLATLDVLPVKWIGVLGLLGGAITLGYGTYTGTQTTPWSAVVAKATSSGLVVAGPAADTATGKEVTVSETVTGAPVAPPIVPPAEQHDRGQGGYSLGGLILLIVVVVLALVGLWALLHR